MKTTQHIPVGKLKRAGKILKTGLKVGRNYATYYGEKMVSSKGDRDKLDQNNASDIMESLQELKGSGLKVAQMLSMEENLLPKAYAEQFSLAQFSVPPLSIPLVKKTFKKYFGENPEEVFDRFDYKSKHAASIGQVHEAWLNDRKLAIKIQYPGVSESIDSDLAMLKPMASRLLNLNAKDTEIYFQEVSSKLVEETDYNLELTNSIWLSEACSSLNDLVFPKYIPTLSNEKILAMEWIDGIHLSEWSRLELTQETRNVMGQRLWDFYMFQLHNLKKLHADPHPGNFLVTPDGKLGVIDFGCIKDVPEYFYKPYTSLIVPNILDDKKQFKDILTELEILFPDDTAEEHDYFYNLFHELLSVALLPYRTDTFDFSDEKFFSKMSTMGQRLAHESLNSKIKPNRGSRHFIYVNRTFFGLYHLLHMLKAEINTEAQLKF